MKLTNILRDAFIRAVMDDVPAIDYDTQIRDLAMKKCVDRLPPNVRRVWDDPQTREYLKTGNLNIGRKHICGLPSHDGWSDWIGEEPPKEWYADLEELTRLEVAQNEARSQLEEKVRAVAYACTTRKALIEAMPEAEKYLPAEAVKSAGVPAVANLVSDLVKAGWPKGGKKEPVAA